MRRRAKIFLVVAAVVAVLIVIADFLARRVVESSLARTMQRRTEAESADVFLHAASVLLAIGLGRVPGVSIRLESPSRNGVTFESLDMELRDVRYRGGAPGIGRQIEGSSGTAVLRVDEAELDEAVAARTEGLVHVQFTENGMVASVDAPGLGSAEAQARIDVRDGDLVLDLQRLRIGDRNVDVPAGVPSPRLPIPNLPPDTHLQGFFVVDATLEVRLAFGAFHAVEGDFRATGTAGANGGEPGWPAATPSMLRSAAAAVQPPRDREVDRWPTPSPSSLTTRTLWPRTSRRRRSSTTTASTTPRT